MRYGNSRTMEYRPPQSRKRANAASAKIKSRKDWINSVIERGGKGGNKSKMYPRPGSAKYPARISPMPMPGKGRPGKDWTTPAGKTAWGKARGIKVGNRKRIAKAIKQHNRKYMGG